MNTPFEALYRMRADDGPLAKHKSKLPAGLSTWDFYWEARDAVVALTRRALHTLRAAAPASKADRVAAVKSITPKLLHDAKLVVHATLCRMLTRVVHTQVMDTIVRPAQEACAPVRAAVEALPEPLHPLFDIDALVADVVLGLLGAAVTRLVDGAFAPAQHALDATAAQLGVAGLE